MESRNVEDLSRVRKEEGEARRRLEEAHARALARAEQSTRRAEEIAAEFERVSTQVVCIDNFKPCRE